MQRLPPWQSYENKLGNDAEKEATALLWFSEVGFCPAMSVQEVKRKPQYVFTNSVNSFWWMWYVIKNKILIQ